MKRSMIFILVLALLMGVVSASIIVHNSSLKTAYFYGETVSGRVNMTLVDEVLNVNITSLAGEKKSLEDFLDFNGADYTCNPLDCSKGYNSISSGSSKTISMSTGNNYYFGLVLEGSNVRLSQIKFDIGSNFVEEVNNPLIFDFFEGRKNWKFSGFSNNFTSRNYGCYNESAGTAGPLIRTSSYCEMIPLQETGKVEMGAIVDTSDTKNLRMTLYPESSSSSLGSCTYSPGSQYGCVISADLGDYFAGGSYKVCVSSDEVTDYKLYSESVNQNCGFVKNSDPLSSTKDYGIFARTAKYKNSTGLTSGGFNFTALAIAADSMLVSKYARDCTKKCYLPISVSGANQNLVIANLSTEINVAGEDRVYTTLHELGIIPTKVDFSGILQFGPLGFKANNSGTYKIILGSTTLVTENIKITAIPVVSSVTPINPPAGIPVLFTANVDFANSKGNLTYLWDFGDGKKNTTKINNVTHTYTSVSNYSMKIKVSSGNLSSEKVFVIKVVSPKSAVNTTLYLRSKQLASFLNETMSFPSWYSNVILKETKYDFFKGEIDRLNRSNINAALDSDYVKIATDLYALDFPYLVYSEKKIGLGLIDDAEKIRPEVISTFAGVASAELFDDYKKAILNWQIENVDSRITSDTIYLEKSSGVKEELMRVYDVSVTSKDSYSESYFVIERSIGDVFIDGDEVDSRKVENSTLVVLNPNEKTDFKFYTLEGGPTEFFVSPRLSSLVLEAIIDKSCNFNSVCETGEDYNTCRSDCKPTKMLVIYLIIIFFVFIISYTLLQIWYDRRYEKHLFEDRRYLFNLLMYMANAKARGKNYGEILGDLKEKGWSREQLNYAIRKAEGKRTGLPEIIPISKILAHKRNKMAQAEIATSSIQQTSRNINKFDFQKQEEER